MEFNGCHDGCKDGYHGNIETDGHNIDISKLHSE